MAQPPASGFGPPVIDESNALSSVYIGGSRLAPSAAYGSTPPKHHLHTNPRQQALPLFMALTQVLLPPILYFFVVTPLTFIFHFKRPVLVWLFPLVGCLPSVLAYMEVRTCRRQGIGTAWPTFGFSNFTWTLLLAVIWGCLSHWYYLLPFYTIDSMKTYTNIDPGKVTGGRLMDAGRVYFSENAMLDIYMGMSFTEWSVYCVAPITDKNLETQGLNATQSTYDLWAVGIDCCSTDNPTFNCGESGNPKARAAIRHVSQQQRKFLELAVQQAAAAYGIQANQPLFFHWVQDPDAEATYFFESGYKLWVLGMLTHAVLNLFLVIAFLTATLHVKKQAPGPLQGPR